VASSASVEFAGVVSKVQTLSDGGLRFTFDVDETHSAEAAALMECKRIGVVLRVVCTEDDGQRTGCGRGKYRNKPR